MAKLAAERFNKSYEKTIREEPFSSMTAMQVCGFEDTSTLPLETEFRFLHGVRASLPALWLERLYLCDRELLDGAGCNSNAHKILTHILGKTPRDYVDMMKAKEAAASSLDNKQERSPIAGGGAGQTAPLCPTEDKGPKAGQFSGEIPLLVPNTCLLYTSPSPRDRG